MEDSPSEGRFRDRNNPSPMHVRLPGTPLPQTGGGRSPPRRTERFHTRNGGDALPTRKLLEKPLEFYRRACFEAMRRSCLSRRGCHAPIAAPGRPRALDIASVLEPLDVLVDGCRADSQEPGEFDRRDAGIRQHRTDDKGWSFAQPFTQPWTMVEIGAAPVRDGGGNRESEFQPQSAAVEAQIGNGRFGLAASPQDTLNPAAPGFDHPRPEEGVGDIRIEGLR